MSANAAANAGAAAQPAFGRYTLHEEIGRGATAIIYRGHDPSIDRTLAIKTLRPEFAESEDFRLRFLTEARAAGNLTHPAIVTVFDVGAADGLPFIAMELLDGPSLAAFVAEHGPLAPRTVVRIVLQIAEALDYAHRAGVVHQDIKPENIAVTDPSGKIKVMDFGIARVRGTPLATGAAPISGTPHYMSPEQIRGKALDGRSDLYALGVLLYWLLAGRPPFEADTTPDLLRAILRGTPPPLRPQNPATPEALVDVARTLLDKDPAARYQRGAELVEDLRRIDEALGEREDEWTGRRIVPLRVRWTALMSALVALTVGLGLGLVYHKQNAAMSGVAYDYGLTLAQMLAVESAEDLLLKDHIALQVLVDEMARNHNIVQLAISDRDGRIVAATEAARVGTAAAPAADSRHVLQRDARNVYEADDGQAGYILFDAPIAYEQRELGRIELGLSTAALDAANRTTLLAMAAAMLVILLCVFIGAYVLSRRLVVPIEILRTALRQIGRGRFDTRIRLHRNDEFERLFAAYNTMADTLEARLQRGNISARRGRQAERKP